MECVIYAYEHRYTLHAQVHLLVNAQRVWKTIYKQFKGRRASQVVQWVMNLTAV